MGIADRLGVATGSGLYGESAPAPARAADPSCSMCSGSGRDELFDSPCLCTQKELAPLKPAFRRGGGAATEATPVPMGARSFKANKFPGSCDLCGGRVEAEAGLLVKVGAKWGARHHEGQCVERKAKPEVQAPIALRAAERVIPNRFEKGCFHCSATVATGEGYAALQLGHWATYCSTCANTDFEAEARAKAEARATVDSLVDQVLATAYPDDTRKGPSLRVAIPALGENDLDFFVIARSDSGQRTVLRTLGGHGDISLKLAEQARQIGRIAELDRAALLEATALYGRELAYCGRCGRELTDQASRDAGIGPECAKKGL